MRLDHGIPLTPKLLGYTHDENGQLVINEEEAPTVKLAFYMYLYGYSTQQIADELIALGHKSYKGNIKWTAGGVLQILRNERHWGDVLTRKTYT
ncbi:recombinase family protein, partial [Klebsiella pneumoniae]|uniref:recombinase family protein n=1 Tax=Klebsiella pneumoniae TaxID=573 RepID=UPI0025A30654